MITGWRCTRKVPITKSRNNRVSGVIPHGGGSQSPSPLTYDAAGNITEDATSMNQYLYDAEGRICAVESLSGLGGSLMTGYLYNGDGVRIAKGSITSWSCGLSCVPVPCRAREIIHDAEPQVLTDYCFSVYATASEFACD